MRRWLCRVLGLSFGHVCLSEQRKARLRALAHHVGREQPPGASDDDCMHAVLKAYHAAQDRAWLAERRAAEAEQVLRDLLSLQLGAKVPDSMPVEPDAIFRQLVRARRAGGALG